MKKTTTAPSNEETNLIQNDMEQIENRLNHEYIAYYHIHDNTNFPLLVKGDVLALRKNDLYKIKDIVLYQSEGEYFLRRIIGVDEHKFYVCGDNEFEVRTINPKIIIARAISRERGKNRLSLILMNKKRIYSRMILRKAKIRMKKHLIDDDEATIKNLYQQISSSHEEANQIESVPVMKMDARLAQQLASFKSPEERLKEFLSHSDNE